MPKNAYFGPHLAVFGPKILIFMGVSKSFGTDIMEKPPRQLVRIVFGQAWDHIGRKDPKSQFSTKFGRLWAKNPNFYESK